MNIKMFVWWSLGVKLTKMDSINNDIQAPNSLRKYEVPNNVFNLSGLLTSSRTIMPSNPKLAITVNNPLKLIA